MDNNRDTPHNESDRFKLEKEIEPPYIEPERFHSLFETELSSADDGALPEELRTEIQKNLDDLQTEMEIYSRFWRWAQEFDMSSEGIFNRLQPSHLLEEINDKGMTKGMQSIDGRRHLTLPQPPVHNLRPMEQITLLVLDRTDEPKSVGEIAEEMAALLQETLESYLQDKPDESEPSFVEHAREWLDENAIDQMEASFQDKLQSRIQYNLGSLDEKQYITRKPDPSDKRRTIIELTSTGELWVDTYTHSESDQDPIDSILDEQVTSYLGVEKE